jgi:hypothetical protein
LRLFIASLLIFSIIILFLFVLFPSEISVSRVVQIRSSRQKIQNKIADLREWISWNELYSNGLKSMENIDAPLRIDSLIIQKSFFKINFLKSVPDTVITLWRQEKRSFEGQYILTENNGQTVLNWTLHFHIKWYPWEKLASMFYDKQLGPIMEKSLLNLRNEMENPG